MNSRMLAKGSRRPLRSARRKATVTISVPLALSASRIASGEQNLPVPRMRREPNFRPAMVRELSNERIDHTLVEEGKGCRVRETRGVCLIECRPGACSADFQVGCVAGFPTRLPSGCRMRLICHTPPIGKLVTQQVWKPAERQEPNANGGWL